VQAVTLLNASGSRNIACLEPTAIPFPTEAMKSNLLRLQNEWATAQASRGRDAIYGYLAAVFELVTWWEQERKAVKRARWALHLRGYSSAREPEPFAAVILWTADHDQVDDRTRSKWSRVLRYAAERKDLDEPLRDFIKRQGGINRCAARFARRLRRRCRMNYGFGRSPESLSEGTALAHSRSQQT
jgi:hypothetical protein